MRINFSADIVEVILEVTELGFATTVTTNDKCEMFIKIEDVANIKITGNKHGLADKYEFDYLLDETKVNTNIQRMFLIVVLTTLKQHLKDKGE